MGNPRLAEGLWLSCAGTGKAPCAPKFGAWGEKRFRALGVMARVVASPGTELCDLRMGWIRMSGCDQNLLFSPRQLDEEGWAEVRQRLREFARTTQVKVWNSPSEETLTLTPRSEIFCPSWMLPRDQDAAPGWSGEAFHGALLWLWPQPTTRHQQVPGR